MEQRPLLQNNGRTKSSIHFNKLQQKTMLVRVLLVLGVLSLFSCGVWLLNFEHETYEENKWIKDMKELKATSDECKQHIIHIPQEEYVERQQKLASTLISEGAQAYIIEPSATMTYYTNMTWSRTERPFLIVFTLNNSKNIDDNDDNRHQKRNQLDMTIITPLFEQTRAQVELNRANLSPHINVQMVPWIEHGDVYETVKSVLDEKIIIQDVSSSSSSNNNNNNNNNDEYKIFIEPTTRLFIAEGIQQSLKINNKYKVKGASLAIQQLRMIKSPLEINIMRCANQLTELAIRKVKNHVKVGMTENQIANLMTDALENYVGLINTWVVALIDANAALPHGNPQSIHQVHDLSLVLIDTGGELYGYQSDTTRTFFISDDDNDGDDDKKKMNATIEKAWYTVHQAQSTVLSQIKKGDSCADVDLTARHVIEKDGLGEYFTHRLGHGIGLEMHEDPYMNQGNTNCFLQPGYTFSVEPGVYLTNEFGIRLEDIVVVNQEGHLEVLTNGLAQNPWTL